jgi:hypothetical protein
MIAMNTCPITVGHNANRAGNLADSGGFERALSPGERFATLKERLGDAFEVIEIDSGPGNEHGFGRAAHSVLTLEVRGVDGHPAYEARERVVEFLKERLV